MAKLTSLFSENLDTKHIKKTKVVPTCPPHGNSPPTETGNSPLRRLGTLCMAASTYNNANLTSFPLTEN